MKEKRKYKRVKVNSPLSFTGIDTGGFTIEGGMGLVRDINPTGIQIETFLPLQSEYIGLTFVDLKKREINASGRVIYCTENESGLHRAGVELTGNPKDNLYFISALTRFYHSLKRENVQVQISRTIPN